VIVRGLAVVLVAAGCSNVTAIGDVDGEAVQADGTGFAWIDATTYALDADRLRLTDRPSEDVVLRMVFTEAVFDPTADLRSLSGAERDRVAQDLRDGDRVDARVRRGDQLLPGDTLEFHSGSSALPPEASPFIDDVVVALGRPPVNEVVAYPDEVLPLGRDRRAQLELSQTSPRLVGRLDVQINADDDVEDLEDVKAGAFSILFDVELLPERLAECNFDPAGAGAGVDPCGDL
jgi:hypothetical protein